MKSPLLVAISSELTLLQIAHLYKAGSAFLKFIPVFI